MPEREWSPRQFFSRRRVRGGPFAALAWARCVVGRISFSFSGCVSALLRWMPLLRYVALFFELIGLHRVRISPNGGVSMLSRAGMVVGIAGSRSRSYRRHVVIVSLSSSSLEVAKTFTGAPSAHKQARARYPGTLVSFAHPGAARSNR